MDDFASNERRVWGGGNSFQFTQPAKTENFNQLRYEGIRIVGIQFTAPDAPLFQTLLKMIVPASVYASPREKCNLSATKGKFGIKTLDGDDDCIWILRNTQQHAGNTGHYWTSESDGRLPKKATATEGTITAPIKLTLCLRACIIGHHPHRQVV